MIGVRLPDGRTIQVQTSDPAAAATAARRMLARESLQRGQDTEAAYRKAQDDPRIPDWSKALARGSHDTLGKFNDFLTGVDHAAASGMSYGLLDPIEGAAAAVGTGVKNAVDRLQGKTPEFTASDAYAAQRDLDAQKASAFQRAHPAVAPTAGILGGFAAPGSDKVAAFINKGASVMPGAVGALPALARGAAMSARGAVAGGLLGGVSGAASARPGEEAQGALNGAGQGALIGGALPVAAKVAEGVTNGVVAPMVRTVARAANRGLEAAGGQPFLDPARQAGQRLAEALRDDGANPGEVGNIMGQWLKSGVTPTLMDVASALPNGGQKTLGLLRGAALKAGPGRGIAMNYNDQTEASLAGRAAQLARGLTPNKGPAQAVQDTLAEARDRMAAQQYREPYATPVDTAPVVDPLSGQAGRDALRMGTKLADANRSTDEMAELQAIRNAANPPAPATEPAPAPAQAGPPPINPAPSGPGLDQAQADVRDYRAGQTGSLFSAIRAKGGLKLRAPNGASIPGPDVEPYIDGLRRPGLINNTSGLSGERLAQSLADEGWFGPNPGDPFDAFSKAFEREGRGTKVFHPSAYAPDYGQRMQQIESDLAQAGVSANDPHRVAAAKLWEMRNGDQAEREAIQWEGNLGDPHLAEFDRLSASQPDNMPLPPVVRLGTLDHLKQGLNEMGREAADKGNNRLAAGLFQRAAELDDHLAEVSQPYAIARDNYHQGSNRIEGVNLGRTGMTASPDDYAAGLQELQGRVAGQGPSPAQLDAGVGYRQEITDALAHQPSGAIGTLKRLGTAEDQTANLGATFGADRAGQFQAGINNLRRQVGNSRYVDPSTGSQSAGRLSDALDLADVSPPKLSALGTVFDIVNKVRRGATLSDGERAALVHLGTMPAASQAVSDLPLALTYDPSKPLASGLTAAAAAYGGRQ